MPKSTKGVTAKGSKNQYLEEVFIPRMDDLDTGFHAGLRPVVSDRTRDTAKPKTPYFNNVKQIKIQSIAIQ